MHEYVAIFFLLMGISRWGVLKEWRYVILTKRSQHVNEMMAVAVKKIRIFSGHVFL